MGKGGKKQTIGFRYYMSILMGLSRGPIDEIVQIKVGDLRAWPVPEGDVSTGNPVLDAILDALGIQRETNNVVTVAHGPNNTGVTLLANGTSVTVPVEEVNTVSATGEYAIDAEELFGGDKKEGGIAGRMRVMMGEAAQIVPLYIKNLMGGRVPDFRGVGTIYFDGLLTSLNPYPKKWEIRVRRTTSGWDGAAWRPDLAVVWLRGGTIKAMNGAHIIYECITNRDWGRGMSRGSIDDPTFTAVAQTMLDEGLGLCLRYNRQSELSTFIQDVLDQIGGALYPNRSTGRLSLSLLRGDYDVSTIPLFTYNTGLISIEESETASQEDIRNEVIVKWTDPIGKEERSARVQNIASRQTTGALNSTTMNYKGISTQSLALRLAQRDLKANANSLKRYKVVLDRRAWKITPGAVFRISVPQRNIFNAVLRAGKVSEAGGSDGRITVEAVLDVFGLPSASFISPQESEWTAPGHSALVANRRMVREATYGELASTMDPANLQILDPTVGAVATVVGKPSPLSQAYEVRTLAEGDENWRAGSGPFAPYVISSAPITRYQEVIPFSSGLDIGLIAVGAAVQIDQEIARLTDITLDPITGGGTITIRRGCFDTIPTPHAADTAMFVIVDEVGGDGREFAAGESVEVKIMPYTSTSTLARSLAPIDIVSVVGRQGRPYPPGDVRANGIPFGDLGGTELQSTVALTWTHRDRITQQDRLIAHQFESIGPEPGVTYTVRVYDGNTGTPVRTVTGIATAGFDYTSTMATEDLVGTSVWFEIESVRAGLVSFMNYRFGVNFNPDEPPPP